MAASSRHTGRAANTPGARPIPEAGQTERSKLEEGRTTWPWDAVEGLGQIQVQGEHVTARVSRDGSSERRSTRGRLIGLNGSSSVLDGSALPAIAPWTAIWLRPALYLEKIEVALIGPSRGAWLRGMVSET